MAQFLDVDSGDVGVTQMGQFDGNSRPQPSTPHPAASQAQFTEGRRNESRRFRWGCHVPRALAMSGQVDGHNGSGVAVLHAVQRLGAALARAMQREQCVAGGAGMDGLHRQSGGIGAQGAVGIRRDGRRRRWRGHRCVEMVANEPDLRHFQFVAGTDRQTQQCHVRRHVAQPVQMGKELVVACAGQQRRDAQGVRRFVAIPIKNRRIDGEMVLAGTKQFHDLPGLDAGGVGHVHVAPRGSAAVGPRKEHPAVAKARPGPDQVRAVPGRCEPV